MTPPTTSADHRAARRARTNRMRHGRADAVRRRLGGPVDAARRARRDGEHEPRGDEHRGHAVDDDGGGGGGHGAGRRARGRDDLRVVSAPGRSPLALLLSGYEVLLAADGATTAASGATFVNEGLTNVGVQPPRISTAMSATCVGVRPTRTPRASSASALATAVPLEPDTMAPAWPMVLPGGAVKPAM